MKERDELSALGYQFSLDSLREKPSENTKDELADSFEIAKEKSQEALRREQEKVGEAGDAKSILRRHQEEISQARHHLRTAAKELVVPGSTWQRWSSGFWRLLEEVVGGTRTDIEELDSIEINLDDLKISEQETRIIKWLETVSWLSGRMSHASDGIRDGLDSVERESAGPGSDTKPSQ